VPRLTSTVRLRPCPRLLARLIHLIPLYLTWPALQLTCEDLHLSRFNVMVQETDSELEMSSSNVDAYALPQ
jgi:hypothetical protein